MIEIMSANAQNLEKAILDVSCASSCIDALTSAMLNPCARWTFSRAVGQDMITVLRQLSRELTRAVNAVEAALDEP